MTRIALQCLMSTSFLSDRHESEKNLPLKLFSLTFLSEDKQTIVACSLSFSRLCEIVHCTTKNAEKVSASRYCGTKNYLSVQFPLRDRLHRHMARFLFSVIVIIVIFFCCFVLFPFCLLFFLWLRLTFIFTAPTAATQSYLSC